MATKAGSSRFRDRWFFGPVLLGMIAVMCAGFPTPAALGQEASASCVLSKKVYTCDLATLRRALSHVNTIAIENDPQDVAAHRQLKELVVALGKTVATGPASIVLVLRPADETGVNIGPADTDLATLRVYAMRPNSAQRELLWSETYRGQADRPWPIVVHSVIQQFQERLR